MKTRFIFALYCLIFFTLYNQVQAAIPLAERTALQKLYAQSNGVSWLNQANLNAAIGTECSWYGVICDADETTITGINLKANNLIGVLPLELNNLTNLINTDFRYNAVYSSEQALIDFLDATGPVGSLLDSQTLDADGLVFSNVTNTGIDLDWNPVNYQQAGGYRIYMAQQIDSVSGSIVTDFVEVALIADKTITTTSFSNLTTCQQYFFKVVSYTNAHADNANTIHSDGIGGPTTGTIPGYTSSCDLVGSQYDDSFIFTSGGSTVTAYFVVINMKNTGERIYNIVSPGDSIILGSINTGLGSDSITVTANDAVAIGNVVTSGSITINDNDISLIDGNISFNSGGSISGNIDLNGALIESSLVVNEPASPPQLVEIGPVEPIDTNLGVFEVSENTPMESVITNLIVHSIFDSAGTTFTINIGNESASFKIDSVSRELILAKSLDFESKSSYELTIEVDNGKGLIVPYTLSVVVSDVNETNESGGGCTLNKNARFDPFFPVMLLISIIYLLSRRFLYVER